MVLSVVGRDWREGRLRAINGSAASWSWLDGVRPLSSRPAPLGARLAGPLFDPRLHPNLLPNALGQGGTRNNRGTAREEICRPALATCVPGRGLRVQADAPGQPGRHPRLWLVTAAELEPATLSFEG